MARIQPRHLDTARVSTAAIASILERGGASDILALMRALRADPHGQTADAALRAAGASAVYDCPELIRVSAGMAEGEGDGGRWERLIDVAAEFAVEHGHAITWRGGISSESHP